MISTLHNMSNEPLTSKLILEFSLLKLMVDDIKRIKLTYHTYINKI